MKKIVLFLTAIATCVSLYAQPFTWTENNGMVSYVSNFPPSNLHFFMFDDGYYRVSKYPTHFYTSGLHETVLYTVGNKQGDNPRKHKRNVNVSSHTNPGPIPHQPLDINGTIETKPSWNITVDYFGMLLLEFQNDFSQSSSDGCITLEYDPTKLIITVNPDTLDWADLQGHVPGVISWSYANLMPGEQRVLYLPTQSTGIPTAVMNYQLKSTLAPGCLSPIVSTSSYSTSTVPHDPNRKLVTNTDHLAVTRLLPQNIVPQKVVYRVEFFNDGATFAQNIAVFDNIHPKADPNSFEFLGSSHPCIYQVQGNTIEINYFNINLPGMDQNDPRTYAFHETQAYYEYSLCIDERIGLPAGQECLETSAAIYFDNQNPVWAHNSICSDDAQPHIHLCQPEGQDLISKTSSVDESTGYTVFPNPTSDIVYVRGIEKNAEVKIINSSGNRIWSPQSQVGELTAIDVQTLAAGLYILKIKHNKSVSYLQFVKLE